MSSDTIKATNYDTVKAALSGRVPFDHASMSAKRKSWAPYRGYLNGNDFTLLSADIDANPEPTYIVFSYSTPIAWIRPDGTAYVTEQKFSATTSKQQTYVRGYLK